MKSYAPFTFFFLVNFLNILWLQANASGNETDSIALLKFKEGISSDPQNIFGSWNHSLHFCNWFGVRCSSKHQRVTSLELQGRNLVGSISPYIGNLSFLRFINLQNNTLHGPIPQQIGNLFRLQSFLVINNSLTGEIPVNLTRCSELTVIGLQGNNLTGKIPEEIGSLLKLEQLLLSMNNLRGELPATLQNLSSLIAFRATYNGFIGNIPDDMSRLTSLETFSVGANQLSGIIPPSIFNISSLRIFTVTSNHLEGSLPESIGTTLPNLTSFGIGENDFSGSIPSSLFNASQLEIIDLGWNNFSGQVPLTLGNLKSLWRIRLHGNNLGSNSSTDLDFLNSLVNCTNLKILDFGRNNFGGVLPNYVANLSSELNLFYFGRNQIQGSIPGGLENLINLVGLVMNYNFMSGVIPKYIGKLQKLQVLDFFRNRFSGQIPSSIGNLTRLSMLYLSRNRFEGNIPSSFGNLKNLNTLAISYNNLIGTIPVEILSLFSLSQALDLSYNSLTGNLPSEIGKLSTLTALYIQGNNLSGEIPRTIGNCLSLEYLYLDDNSFQGAIPSSFTSLKNLHYLDLSRNNLSGPIPEALESFQYLVYLNLSFNNLEGEIPTGGIFQNASAFSLVGNNKLCGGIPELSTLECPEKERKKRKSLAFKLAIVIPCVAFVVLMMLASFVVYYKLNSKYELSSTSSLMINGLTPDVSYRDLFRATDQFSSANLIGSGNFGSVYKGTLDRRERPVAVKVLNLEQKGAVKTFIAECKALENVKHRNLVKMLTYCSTKDYKGNDFKALVFEYMGNGSLETWLHPDVQSDNQSRNLNFLGRLNIAFDVASAMYYLHDLCERPVIHRDLKPSNVLLDDDMVAHVCDFGLAKLVSTSNAMSKNQLSTNGINGTIGYTAPEYGMGSEASKEGDVYSYGVLVLEMFTGKRPTDKMFEEGLNLRAFVKNAFPDRVLEIVDKRLLSRDDPNPAEGGKMEFISILEKYSLSILKIGLACSRQSPRGRLSKKDVIRELDFIRNAFLNETRTTI
ncbi:Receptor kinase-like protein Xa21 [Euphorbia peplus]|nr:Receptor kinase-like protein Xa21 [Euphorbia peplus]